MWFNIIKGDSLEQVSEELLDRLMPLIRQALIENNIEPTESNMYEYFIKFVKSEILQGKKYPHEFLEV
jgi:hypothetical protein